MKVAVIGTGSWGKHHLRVFNEMGYLAAFVEKNHELRKTYENKYNVPGFPDIQSLTKKIDLDAVTVCTPTATHYEIAQNTLSHGIATLVEKPLTYSSHQGQELVDIAKDNHAILTVGFIERFNPVIMGIKDNLLNKKLGEPLLLEFQRENRWAGITKDIGVILDSSVHDIDASRWLFNDEPNVVFARTGNVITKHDDFATIILGFKNQKTAIIIANWVTPYKVRRISVTCTEGNMTGNYISQEIQIDDGKSITIPKKKHEEPLQNELTSFIESIQSKQSPLVTGIDGVRTTQIAEAALSSAKRGVPIYMEL